MARKKTNIETANIEANESIDTATEKAATKAKKAEVAKVAKELADKAIKSRIDAAVYISVKDANPNGDPNGNGPRYKENGYGFITDVAVKGWIRHILHILGYDTLIRWDCDANDGFACIKERLESYEPIKKAIANKDVERAAQLACERWIDVRLFGCMIPYNGSLSIGLRGPATFCFAESVSPINITENNITKGSNMNLKDGKSSDRMGTKTVVDFGLYKIQFSISPYAAERTGLTAEDVEILHGCLPLLCEENTSAARPAGSMNVERIYWWDHSKSATGAKLPKFPVREVVNQVTAVKKGDPFMCAESMDEYEFVEQWLDGIVKPEIYPCFAENLH